MMGARSLVSIGVAFAAAALAGCASQSPSCDLLCPVARPAFEGCMETWGLAYGAAVGYEDADDYDAWCTTWVLEQEVLADTAEDDVAAFQALETRCESITQQLQGDDCAVYWGLWD